MKKSISMGWPKFALVAAAVVVVAIAALFLTRRASGEKEKLVEVILLHSPECPHCRNAMAFLDKLGPKYPEVEFTRYNIETGSGGRYYVYYKDKLGWDGIGVPVAVFGDRYVLGFGDENSTGKKYVENIESMLSAAKSAAGN